MEILAAIDPVTRLEGHLKVRIKVDTVNGVQQVIDSWSVGTLYRGFETLLLNRDPRDAQHITERICGVCPVSHAMAAVLALDKAAGLTIPSNARIMRNIVMGANFLDSHILHFYLLALLDFINGPAMAPWQPSWNVDRRFDAAKTATLVEHYKQAVNMRRKAHELGAIFGGRMPHPPSFIPGGITAVPKSEHLTKMRAYLTELVSFIQNVYIPDAELLTATYPDYLNIGRGHRHLLAFGCFDLDAAGTTKLLKRGQVFAGSTTVQNVDLNMITEQVSQAWYADSTNNLNPAMGQTVPQNPKGAAYSWIKAPRYNGAPYECGPLARMWVNGEYRKGISVMDRHRARAYEALKIAKAMQTWVSQIQIGQPAYATYNAPYSATVTGLTEAARGALGHWVQISGGKIARYQVVTPTCWNCSPRDAKYVRGPLEQALIGVPVKDINQPIEVLRVIHSIDPCLDCAVHVMRPDEGAKVFSIGHFHGGSEEPHTHSHGEGHSHAHGHSHSHDHGHAHPHTH